MNRAALALGLVLILVPVMLAQESADKSPAEQYQSMAKEYQTAYDEYLKASRIAKTPEERAKLRYPDFKGYADKMVALAKKNPDDPAAFDALAWAFQKRNQEALKLIIKDHLKNAKITAVMRELTYAPSPDAEQFFQAVLDNHDSDKVKGVASLHFGTYLHNKTNAVAYLQKPGGGPMEADLEKQYGKAFVKQLRDADLDALIKETVETIERGAKKLKTEKDLAPAERALLGRVEKDLDMIRTRSIGKVVPDIEGEDGEEKAFKLSDHKGQVVMIDFWGQWCGPCRAMYPHNRALMKKMEGKPFVLLGVNSDKTRQTIKEAMEKEKNGWRYWFDGGKAGGPIASAWNVYSWPTIYVIDHKGVIRYKNLRGENLERAVEALVKDAEPKQASD